MTIKRVRPQVAPPCKCEDARDIHWMGFCWRGQESLLEDIREHGIAYSYIKDAERNIAHDAAGRRIIFICDCTRYRKGRSLLRGTKRSIHKDSKNAELRVAHLVGGKRKGNSGKKNEDVYVKKLGELAAIFEVKQGPWKALFSAYDQIMQVPTAGSPRRLVAFVEKPGPGRPSRILICEEGNDWVGWNGRGDEP